MTRSEYMKEWRVKNRSHLRDYATQWASGNRTKYSGYREEARARHNEAVNAMKVGPCKGCGNCFPPSCMEFDHLPGAVKVDSVSRMIGHHSLESILLEIAKCDLVCRNCHRTRTALRTGPADMSSYGPSARLTIQTVNELKARPCMDCLSTFPAEAMDFDHTSGNKISGIGRMKRSASLQRVMTEISKCDLVCANCHAVRTYTRDADKLRIAARHGSRRVAA